MQAVILAGGKPARLHPPDMSVPKPMLPLFDRPIVEHTIRLLAKHGITDIIVAASYLAYDLAQYLGDGARFGVKIRYSVEAEPMGTAGAIKLLQSMIHETTLVVSGDAVTDFDVSHALSIHRASSAVATLMLQEVDEPSEFGVAQCDSAGKLTRFAEKPESADVFASTVSTGIYVLEPDVLSCIPFGQAYDIACQLIPRMLNNQEPIYGFAIPGYWRDAGDLRRYRNAHFDALSEKVKLELPATHIGGGVWLGERVQVDASVELSAPIYLGSGVTIRREAVVGENSVIGSETLVDEAAHISRSVIGNRSFVGRNARVSDSVIGSGYYATEAENVDSVALVGQVHYDLPETVQVAPAAQPTVTRRAERVPA